MSQVKLLITGVCLSSAAALLAQDRPNILWLSIEDTSPYDFACYGNKNVHQPVIDSLARNGIQYMQAHSCGPQSSPSRSGIITGCYASTYAMEWHRMQIPTPTDIFLPQYMREAGYYCTNKSKTDYNTSVNHKALWDECGPNASYNNPARKKGQPFFSVFNCMATHMGRIRSFHTDGRRDFSKDGLDPDKLELPPHVPDIPEIRSDYAFHMEGSLDMDKWVDIFLKDLRSQGLDENTIVFFFSDHGGCLPRGKGFLYETGTRVPFIVYFPEKWKHLANGQSGKTDRMIGFPDLAPTVLSLVGIKPPEYMQGKAFLGKYEESPKTYEFGLKANQASHFNPERSVTDGKYNLIVRYIPYKNDALMNAYQWGMPGNIWWDDAYLSGKISDEVHQRTFNNHQAEMLFDIENDPYELNNLINDPRYAKEVERLRKELDRHLRETADLGFFLKSQRQGKEPIYYRVHNGNYDLNALYDLAELTGKVRTSDLPYLKKCLKSNRPEIRFWATVNISELIDKGDLKKAPKEFHEMLNDEDVDVACEAAYGLCLLGFSKEAMEFLGRTDANGRINSSRITMLENIAILPQAPEYFTDEVISVLNRMAGAGYDVSDESMMQFHIAARKVLINLKRMPATELWGKDYYEQGLKINKERRPLVPTPFMNNGK
ncbi:MAG: sulfatase-like hydrolase/transferase [Candidatus Cryptobacteroides sp.]